METVSMKTCPLCREQIDAAARKCPRCQYYQNRWTMLACHPMTAAGIITLVMVIMSYSFNRIFSHGEDFEPHRVQIHVVQSTMEFGERTASKTTGPTVAVVGTIQNDSGITWKDAVIEVQFFDKGHKLIDAAQQSSFMAVVLTSGAPNAFKVSMPREFDPGLYASHEVRVVSARDARGFLP